MGRPSLDLGTAGAVRVYKTSSGYRAMTRYRDWDGKVRQIERHAATKGASTRILTLAIRNRATGSRGPGLTAETKIFELAQIWFDQALESDFSPGTLHLYRDCLDRQILPAMADLRIRELTTGLVDRHLAVVRRKHGSALAKTTKSVLSNMCRLTCRYDALAHNPCRDVARISARPRKRPTALSVEEVRRLTLWLSQDPRSVARDLPDLVSFLLATGLRIGEALAVRWSDLDLEAGTVDIQGTVLRLRPGGLIIKPSTKSAAGQRILELPSWGDRDAPSMATGSPAVDRRRHLRCVPCPRRGRSPGSEQHAEDDAGILQGRRVRRPHKPPVPQNGRHPDGRRRTVRSSGRGPARALEDVADSGRLHGAEATGHRGGRGFGAALPDRHNGDGRGRSRHAPRQTRPRHGRSEHRTRRKIQLPDAAVQVEAKRIDFSNFQRDS